MTLLKKQFHHINSENSNIAKHFEIRYKGEVLSTITNLGMIVINDPRIKLGIGLKLFLNDLEGDKE